SPLPLCTAGLLSWPRILITPARPAGAQLGLSFTLPGGGRAGFVVLAVLWGRACRRCRWPSPRYRPERPRVARRSGGVGVLIVGARARRSRPLRLRRRRRRSDRRHSR